jgi:hypothetical protein
MSTLFVPHIMGFVYDPTVRSTGSRLEKEGKKKTSQSREKLLNTSVTEKKQITSRLLAVIANTDQSINDQVEKKT